MHCVKRTDIYGYKAFIIRISAIVIALAFGGIFVAFMGLNPFSVYGKMLSGSFGTKMAIQATVKIAVPLLIASLGLALAFKMRFWNIGAEGQICIGAIAASYFALYCSEIPHILLLVIMLVVSALAAGIWGLIPAFFKAKFGTNETLFTLMMNYVALYIIVFLKDGPWKDPEAMGFNKIAMFADNARLPKLFGIHIGWIIALIILVLVYVYIKYTKSGYEINVVGESENTARYAGMNVKKIILKTMFLSSAICGIAGMIQATGADYTLSENVAGGDGFTAIIIAWMGRLNPIAILIVTILFSILERGGTTIQRAFNISSAASSVLQGIILFFVLGSEFFINYKIVLKRGSDK